MLRRMVGEWMSRGWKVPRCLMMVGYDDLDRSRSEFSFVLKSRIDLIEAILVSRDRVLIPQAILVSRDHVFIQAILV
eukprot:745002-Amorphochlora_amoeboformis.AAC.1